MHEQGLGWELLAVAVPVAPGQLDLLRAPPGGLVLYRFWTDGCPHCRALIDLGYRDGMDQASELRSFFTSENRSGDEV